MAITPHLLDMESETVLTQYLITNWTLAYNNASNVDAGIKMTLVLKRRILNAILTVYLPTILVLIIVYATNFFKDFFFELGVCQPDLFLDENFQGDSDSEPDLPAGADHLVHQRGRKPSPDRLHQDGRHLADLRSGEKVRATAKAI